MLGQTIEDYGLGTSILLQMQSDSMHRNVRIRTSDGKIVTTHSILLASVSNKFKGVFEKNAFGIYNLNTPQVSSYCWDLMLSFVYTGHVQLPKKSSAFEDLLAACQTLDFSPLLSHLLNDVGGYVTEEESTQTSDSPRKRTSSLAESKSRAEGSVDEKPRLSLSPGAAAAGEEVFQCDLCNVILSSARALSSHRGHHKRAKAQEVEEEAPHVPATPQFQCDSCSMVFNSSYALGGHRSRNTACNPTKHDGEEFKCDICQNPYSSRKAMLRHRASHAAKAAEYEENNYDAATGEAGESLFSCDLCDKVFYSSKSLQTHRGHHTRKTHEKEEVVAAPSLPPSEPSGIYKCDECSQQFDSTKALQAHIGHHRRSSIACPVCKRRCASQLYLQRHIMRSHKNFDLKKLDKSGKGTLAGKVGKAKNKVHSRLGAISLQKQRIKRMIKTKSKSNGEEQLRCPLCPSATFDKPFQLTSHLKSSHMGEKWREVARKQGYKKSQLPPYMPDYINKKCVECSLSFSKLNKSVSHQRRVHNNPRPFQCAKCLIFLKTRTGLRSHINNVHFPQWRAINCKHCDFVAAYYRALYLHIKKSHLEVDVKDMEDIEDEEGKEDEEEANGVREGMEDAKDDSSSRESAKDQMVEESAETADFGEDMEEEESKFENIAT